MQVPHSIRATGSSSESRSSPPGAPAPCSSTAHTRWLRPEDRDGGFWLVAASAPRPGAGAVGVSGCVCVWSTSSSSQNGRAAQVRALPPFSCPDTLCPWLSSAASHRSSSRLPRGCSRGHSGHQAPPSRPRTAGRPLQGVPSSWEHLQGQIYPLLLLILVHFSLF